MQRVTDRAEMPGDDGIDGNRSTTTDDGTSNTVPRSTPWCVARANCAHLLMRPICMGSASYLTTQRHAPAHLHVRNYRNGSGKDLLPTHVIM